ncbi:MAG: glycerate kinase [Verrucomicrobiota bacterium]|nr:glycerate kinase [Verrucomicrobiota bacterium]
MRILIAPDKFKHSLGAKEVAEHIAAGLRDELPKAEITLLPIADGGEGFASVICAAAKGEWHECDVHDPLGRMVRARYGVIRNGTTAVMEMSEASGLWRLSPNERNPLKTTSFGTGEMLRDAARRGMKEIIMGLGGSATNDGGFGVARALGYRFFANDNEVVAVADLRRLTRIKKPDSLGIPRITIASDVQNPLLGSQGATCVFGPQKGASAEQLAVLEGCLTRLADVVAQQLKIDVRNIAGAGAAGGLGFGLMSFCGARLRPGFKVVAEAIGLEAKIAHVDVVITGEGSLDAQTLSGKAPAGVASLARKLGKPVYAIVGRASDDRSAHEIFSDVYTLTRAGMSDEESMKRAPELLHESARELAKQIRAA